MRCVRCVRCVRCCVVALLHVCYSTVSLLTLQELFDVLVNLFTTLRFRALAMQLPYNMPLVYRDHTTLQELFEKDFNWLSAHQCNT